MRSATQGVPLSQALREGQRDSGITSGTSGGTLAGQCSIKALAIKRLAVLEAGRRAGQKRDKAEKKCSTACNPSGTLGNELFDEAGIFPLNEETDCEEVLSWPLERQLEFSRWLDYYTDLSYLLWQAERLSYEAVKSGRLVG